MSRQPGLFDADDALDGVEAAAARGRMRASIERMRAASVPPWVDEMGVILEDGAFKRAMWLVPADEGQALWAEYDVEMERLYAVWAGMRAS